MTNPEKPQAPTQEVCPHCGSVLDLAKAVEEERSILSARRPARARGRPETEQA